MINCVNHTQKKATQICWKCENWYCSDCVKDSPFGPLCNNCAPDAGHYALEVVKKIGGTVLPFVFGAVGTIFLIFGLTLASLTGVNGFLWISLIGAPGVIYFIYNRVSHYLEHKALPDSKIIKYIQMKNGKITAKQLSILASVSEEKANKRLKDMTVEDKLEFNILENGEIVFSQTKLLE